MKKFCSRPFEHFEVAPDGMAYACCAGWLPRSIGSVLDESPRAMFNGLAARDIRESILDGSFRRCGACPLLKTTTFPVRSVADDADLSAYLPTMPSGPKFMNLAVDQSCNLACPSCRRGLQRSTQEGRDQVRLIQAAALSDGVLEGLDWLSISGSGDPFASAPHLELLRSLSRERYPSLKIKLHTNGTLFNRTSWNALESARDMVKAIEISVDAATPETYAINRGGDWEALQHGLSLASELRAGNQIEIFQLSCVVQANNWHEVPRFVSMALALGADNVFLSAIRNWGTYGEDGFLARAAHLLGHPDRESMRAVVAPCLENARVAVAGLLDD